MPEISVVIITLNVEHTIRRCIDSIQDIADEILVVDSYSTDRTEDICKEYKATFLKHPFEGFKQQKNWAMAQAKYDFILSIDADEALSDTLKESILEVKNNSVGYALVKFIGVDVITEDFTCGFPIFTQKRCTSKTDKYRSFHPALHLAIHISALGAMAFIHEDVEAPVNRWRLAL